MSFSPPAEWKGLQLERAVSIQVTGTYAGGVLTINQQIPFDLSLHGCEVVAWGLYSSVNSTNTTLRIDEKLAFNAVPMLAQNYNPTWIPVGCPGENKVQIAGIITAGSAPNVALQLAFYRKNVCNCQQEK